MAFRILNLQVSIKDLGCEAWFINQIITVSLMGFFTSGQIWDGFDFLMIFMLAPHKLSQEAR